VLATKNSKKPPKAAPIEGTITPLKWDGKGKPARITIRTSVKEEYDIDFSGAGKELLHLIDQRVVIEGKTKQQLSGRRLLSVMHFQVIDDAPTGE
jgi:hypothetical protein